MSPAEIIRKKRFRKKLSASEIDEFVQKYSVGEIHESQMSALAMAVCLNGMTEEETANLTKSMMNSGVVLDFSHLAPRVVDKHSTGGVGDKTSLILAPLVAAAGLKVPMIAGRGLGHTGGTLDKLESIPGFEVRLSLEQMKQNVETHGFSIIGQTDEICPADKKFYALRDVTGTVDSLPLICGSIMSKKLAEGLSGLVLDVKFGSGAFMKTFEDATLLAESLIDIGKKNSVETHALITSMDQPLGSFIGNALEVDECLRIMRGESLIQNGLDLFADTRELTLWLAAEMLFVGNLAESAEEGYAIANEALTSKKALENFEKMVEFQGGSLTDFEVSSKHRLEIKSDQDGFVAGYEVEAIGLGALQLGAGRKVSSDTIDPQAGVSLHRKIGQQIKAGEAVMTLHYSREDLVERALPYFEKSYWLSASSVPSPELIKHKLR